jgi:two-component system, sensor histidine kinase and response regulator
VNQFSNEDNFGSSQDEQPAHHSVYVIDDQAELLKVISELLKSSGYKVLTFQNALQALDAVIQNPPSLILCDIMMPEMNGYELKNKLQEDNRSSQIPFVLLTALASKEDIRKGQESGCDAYILKPFDPEDLIATIRGRIAMSEKRRAQTEKIIENQNKKILQTLSHELRTPLVSVNTGTEVLRENINNLGHSGVYKVLDSIKRGGQRLQKLVDDVLIVQQIETGSIKDNFQKYAKEESLEQLTRKAISNFVEQKKEEGAQVKIFLSQPNKNLPNVKVINLQVISIIERLLSNAYKFGGSENTISLKLLQRDSKLELTIEDQGPGISEKELQEISKVFTQPGREQKEQQGCGFGLYIASEFARINQGSLTLMSEKGQGFIAKLSLPISIK